MVTGTVLVSVTGITGSSFYSQTPLNQWIYQSYC
jgi:hypothetical protein